MARMALTEHYALSEIAQVLDEEHGHVARAAKRLGVSRQTMYRHIAKSKPVRAVWEKWQQEIVAALEVADTLAEAAEMAGVEVRQVAAFLKNAGKSTSAAKTPPPKVANVTSALAFDQPAPNGNGRGPVASEQTRRDIAPFYRDRQTRTVTVYRSPATLEHVHSLEICVNDTVWTRLPLFGNVRICTGPDVPTWTPEQEVYRSVSKLRVTYADGRVDTLALNANDALTIAPA